MPSDTFAVKDAANRRSLSRIRSKLEVPRTVADQIPRNEVATKIADANWAQLTVLHAASGFGKTVVMSEAFSRMSDSGIDCVWLTIDPADNDASRFLYCLHRAVRRDPVAPKDKSVQTEEELAAALFDLLESNTAPYALFLDDVENLSETPVLELLRELIITLPGSGRIVLASRTSPDLGQVRLRASGKLQELHHNDLRFSLDESERFLRSAVESELSFAQVQQLHKKTEGWPVALRLAAGILERTTDNEAVLQHLSRMDSALSEFLVSEILLAQPAHIQDFLLKTSILRDLEPTLCDRLFAPGGSTEILHGLSRSNVLVSQIEETSGLFRYHGMFASFLRNALVQKEPDTVEPLHRAAMEWYVEQGRIVPAIDHAIEGGDFKTALDMLSKTGRLLLEQGRVRLLSRWFQAIPTEMLRRNPELILQQGWANLFLHGPLAAQSLVDTFEIGQNASEIASVETLCLRTEIHSMLDEFDAALQAGEQALPRIQVTSPFTRTVLLNALAYAYFIEGRFSDASRALQRARAEQSQHDDIFNVMFAESVQGLIDLRKNRLREAKARFRVAAGTTRSGARHKTNGNLMAGIPLACCNYESNDLITAARQLRLHLPFVRNIGPIDHIILCYGMLARIAFCQGDLDQAYSFLTELEGLGCRRTLPRVTAGAKLERARIYMRQEQFGRAREELVQLQNQALWDRVNRQHLPANDLETPVLHQIRLELLDGDPQIAKTLIKAELQISQKQGRYRRAMLLDLLSAAAQLKLGDPEAVFAQAGRALKQCAREGYVRLLLDEGPAVGALVHFYAAKALQGERALRDPLFVDWLQELVSLLPAPEGPVSSIKGESELPLDPLTPKEQEVLKLLDDGHSNAAIGERLFVSNSTVRTHLRNINSKLATTSRGHAVAVARRIGLI